MARLQPITPDELDSGQRALYDAIVTGPRAGPGLADEAGSLRGPFDPLLRIPGVGDAVQRLGVALRYEGSLADDVRELAVVTAASFWQCRFELAVHSRVAESFGVDPQAIAALVAGEPAPLEEGTDLRLVHDAAAELLNSKRLSDATYTNLVATFGEAATVEILVLVGYYSLLAMLLEGLEI